MENAEHTLFVCARWGAEREAFGRAVGAQLTPDTMVSHILQSEQIWMLIESFVTLVMKTRELDGRVERGSNGKRDVIQCFIRGSRPELEIRIEEKDKFKEVINDTIDIERRLAATSALRRNKNMEY